jgi:DNA-binding CsgD family transcriptional regulator
MTRPSTGLTLRGRARELEAVADLLRSGADGCGGAVVFVGDVGSGKSALLAAAEHLAGEATVLTAAGWPSETGLAFAGLHRLLRASAAGLPAGRTRNLVRSLESGTIDSAERVATVLLSLMSAVAKARPVVVCIDDLQLLDPLSREAFGLLAQRVDALPVTLFFATATEAPQWLPGVRRLPLRALDDAASRELLADYCAGTLAGDVAGSLTALAGGNPLALVELAAMVTAEQRHGDAAPPASLPADSRLRRAYHDRLVALPPSARWLVLLLATDPRLDLGELTRAGVDAETLAIAGEVGLVQVEAQRVSFREPIVAALVYADATLAQRRSAHQLLAETLDPATQPLRRWLHRATVAAGQDPELAAQLVAAAETGSTDRMVASRALERAAELTDEPAQAGAYLISAARHAWTGGELHRARTLLRRLRPAELPAQLSAQADLLLGEIELRAGGTNHARQTLLAAASELAEDPELGVDAIMRAGDATLQTGGYAHYRHLADKALALRRDNESASNDLQLEFFTGSTAVYKGEFDASKEPLRRVITLALAIDDPAALQRACIAAKLLGDEHEAHRLATRSAAVARAAGDRAAVPQALDLAASADCALGRIDAATITLLEALPLARATGQLSLASSLLAMLGYTAAIYGDRAACAARLREARAQAATHGAVRPEAVIEYALGVLDLVTGRPADALARLQSLHGKGGRGQLAIGVAATPKVVEAAVRSGNKAVAAKAFAGFEPWALSTDQPLWLAKVARCRAALADDEGIAEHEYRQAIKYYSLDGSEFERAQTELLFGQMLRRRRRPSEAREHLRWALRMFERVDAHTWVELAATELRASGESAAAAEPRAPGEAGEPAETAQRLDALTPQQLQIARLAAAGATNREMAARMSLSLRTVDHHMRNIFARLGLHSRVELAKLIPPAN